MRLTAFSIISGVMMSPGFKRGGRLLTCAGVSTTPRLKRRMRCAGLIRLVGIGVDLVLLLVWRRRRRRLRLWEQEIE